MNVTVDGELCIGCGLCADNCPDVFEMQDDKAVVKPGAVPAGSEECAQESVDNCPVDAIAVV